MEPAELLQRLENATAAQLLDNQTVADSMASGIDCCTISGNTPEDLGIIIPAMQQAMPEASPTVASNDETFDISEPDNTPPEFKL